MQQQQAEVVSRLVGKPILRVEDHRLVRGAGKFVGNVYLRDMLYADIVCSPYAHALIKNIDATKALSLPGVVGVVTGNEAKEFTKPLSQAFGISLDDYCLAPEEVVYVGQPLAAVVAKTPYIAHDAASLIEVDYQPVEPVLNARVVAEKADSTRTHLKLGENRIFHKVFSYGDIDEIFSKADHIVSDSLVFDSYAAIPLEPFGVVADYDRGTGTLTLIDNSQVPSSSVSVLSSAFSIPSNRIRVIQNDIGGGFGVKTALASSEVLVSLLSMRTGHPVKWIETRTEHLASSLHGSLREYDVSMAVRRDGTILGLRVKAFEDSGAFVRRPFTAPISCLRAFGGPYRIEGFEYDLSVVLTNKCPAGSSRGNGKNHHSFMLEKMVDRVAQELNLDPLQLRLQNLIQPEEFPYQAVNGAVYDSGDYPRALSQAAEIIGYKEFKASMKQEREAGIEGKLLGIGLAIVVDGAGSNSAQGSLYGGRAESWGSSEMVSMRMDQTGKVTVALFTSPQGQGHETIASMIVAEKLGIPVEDVFVFIGSDSARNIGTPMSGTYSSRFASIGSSAVILCANKLRKKILKLASSLLKEPEGELELEGGSAISRRSGASIQVSKLARIAYTGTPEEIPIADRGLEAVATYSQQYGRDAEEAKVNFAATYSYQVHAAKVEVDVETGQINILKHVVVDDSGTTLNPTILQGQIQGGTFNGIAAALYERFIYGEDGQLLTTTFMDYLAPTACEIPTIVTRMMETPSPFTLSGAKGVGETGALGAQPAIMNAVEDALRQHAIRIRSSHLTPEGLLGLLRQ